MAGPEQSEQSRKASGRVAVREDGGPSPLPDGERGALGTERASASVVAPTRVGATSSTADDVGIEGPFGALLDWFSTVVTHPTSVEAGVDAAADVQAQLGADRIEAIVAPSDRMSALDRMGIYQYAYHARLVGCLEDDYPVVAATLGAERFEQLARRYIEAHPSDRPNLNHFGRHFAAFVATQGDALEHHRFFADLARLEWAMVQVLHAADGGAISMAALERTPPSQWADVRLPPSPTLRFLEFAYPVNAFLQASRRGEAPALPSPRWSATAVYRIDYRLWRMDFTPPMAAVLGALIGGATLGEALGTLEAVPDDDAAETDVMVWFKEWVMGGFFASVSLSDAER